MNHETRQKAVDILNLLLKEEPAAIKSLVSHRVVVSNDVILDHPTIIVSGDDPATLGLIGLLNGFLSDGKEGVAVVHDENDEICGFEVVCQQFAE